MKTLLTLIAVLGVLAPASASAAPARARTSQQIQGKSYADDLQVLEESQALALEMGQAALEKINDREDRRKMGRAIDLISDAKALLVKAKRDRGQLDAVIRRQEEAFQILLELATKEHRIMRSQQQQSSSSSNQQERQEMNDLELKMKENRYQDRRLANPETGQNQEQQEQLQVLNRLRELARRQNDINERLKQLQTQLQAAEDEREQEELRRQLKRLLEEQKRVLEDMDELDQRMQRPENESRMADARRELQEAREAAQNSARSMEQEKVSQAAATGTRAEQTLNEMQDEFRKKTAGRFAEEMREMRESARELSRRQEELNRKLADQGEAGRKSLAAESKDDRLAGGLRDQNRRFAELLQRAEQVSRQTEVAEPVLHRQLYDSLRSQAQREARNIAETGEELQQRRVITSSIYRMLQEAGDPNRPRSLDIAAELAGMGFKQPAQPIGERAKEALDQFQNQIEKAAESVLGNESEALQRARRELEELAQMLGGELERARAGQAGTNRMAMAAGAGGRERRDGDESDRSGAGEARPEGRAGDAKPGQEQRQGSGREGAAREEQGQDGRKGEANRPGEKNSGQSQEPGQGERPGRNPGRQPGEGDEAAQGRGPGEKPGRPGQSGQGGQAGQGSRPDASGEQQRPRETGQEPGPSPGGRQGQAGQGGQGEKRGGRGEENGRPASARPGTDRSVDGRNGGWGNILPGEAGQIGERDGNNAGPITGDGFAEWADRMRNVEEMVSSDEMRNRLSSVRERVRAMRVEHKRHSKEPEWGLMRDTVMKPLVEVRDQIANELARLSSREAIVPIDRDPVPDRFADLVRRYYETLGRSGKN